MKTFTNELFIISYENEKISFGKILNQGFLCTNRGPIYVLNNNMELAFEKIYGKSIDMTDEEIQTISEFINNNSEKIKLIFNSDELNKKKIIEEL